MQFGDAMVVAVEERKKIGREILLIFGAECADDAEVHSRVLGPFGIGDDDKDIAGMHVGVEEIVAEDLGKKNLDPVFGEPLDICSGFAQGIHVADRDAVDTLLDHDFGTAVVPVDLGHVKHVGTREVALQLRCIGRFTHQVEFVNDRLLVLGHNLERLETFAMFPVPAGQPGQHAQNVEVPLYLFLNAGPQQLDDHFLVVGQLRRMHLGDRCGREWLTVETLEDLVDRLAVGGVENCDGLVRRERWYLVLQLGELVGDVRRQQVAAGRYRLSELDEYRAQLLESQANAFAERCGRVAPPREYIEEKPQRPKQVGLLDEFVETVFDEYPLDAEYSTDRLAPAHDQAPPASWLMRASILATSSRSASTCRAKRSTS